MVKVKNQNKKLKKQKFISTKVEEDVVEIPAKRQSDDKISLKVSCFRHKINLISFHLTETCFIYCFVCSVNGSINKES